MRVLQAPVAAANGRRHVCCSSGRAAFSAVAQLQPPDPRKTPRVSPRGKYGLGPRGDEARPAREPAPPVVRPAPPTPQQFYLAVAQGQLPAGGGGGAAPGAGRRPRLFSADAGGHAAAAAGPGAEAPPPPPRGTPALRRKVCPGFTRARQWTTLRDRPLRRWLFALDGVTAVVAARRLAALQPPPPPAAAAARPRARGADGVIAAAAAAAAEKEAATGVVRPEAEGWPGALVAAPAPAAAAQQWAAADAAAAARGFQGALEERAAFELVVAALCAALAPRLCGFGARGLVGVARRVGALGVRHEGFWQAWCGRASELMAQRRLPAPLLGPALEAMAALEYAPPPGWLQEAHAYTRPRLAQAAPQRLARLAAALGAARPPPGDEWWAAAAAAAAGWEGRGDGAHAGGGGSSGSDGDPDAAAAATTKAAAASRLLLGAAAAAAQLGGAPGPGLRAAADCALSAATSPEPAGALRPGAAATAAAACAAAAPLPLAPEERGAWAAAWGASVDALRRDGWRLSEAGLAVLCDALADGCSGDQAQQGAAQGAPAAAGAAPEGAPWPLPDGWLAGFEAATLPRLPALPPWLLLLLLRAFAARGHAAGARWLGAALLLLRPWGARLAPAQLTGLAEDLGAVLRAGAAASSGGGGAQLPSGCLAALADAAAARAAATPRGGGGGDLEEARMLLEASRALRELAGPRA
ncbi:MAG: hypothetical protein J3K34DRAFT_462709 [Monoraphidium minutum]|nr:MAG: hypothetical protein J3K34DRAFT_462709 [Monoraphidium minutum]